MLHSAVSQGYYRREIVTEAPETHHPTEVVPPCSKHSVTMVLAISLADVEAAAERIKGEATLTPVMTSRTMDSLSGRLVVAHVHT